MRQTIELKGKEGETINVKAVVRGPLAIHHTWVADGLSDTFAITHVPTGIAIDESWRSRFAAKRLLRKLTDLDWNRNANEIRNDGAMFHAVRAAIREVVAESR